MRPASSFLFIQLSNARIKTDKLYKNNICSEISLTEKEKYAIILVFDTF